MADYAWSMYDTAPFGASASVTNELFQVAQGGDATHTKSFTNSRGAGQLPVLEKMMVERIKVIIDYNTVLADIPKIQVGSYLEFIVNNKTVLLARLAEFFANSSYGGHYSQAAAADEAAIALNGDGYELKIPILIPGGTQFKVNVFQGTALAGANSNLIVSLNGILTMT